MAGSLLRKLERRPSNRLVVGDVLVVPWFDRSPAMIEYMLSSDDPAFRDGAIPSLLGYLRQHAHFKPFLGRLADLIDPVGDTKWKLEFKRRRRGSLPANDRSRIRDAEIVHRVCQLTAELKAKRSRSPRKQALTMVAKQGKVSVKTIEAAVTRFNKSLSK